jgi:hypothetical protein
MEMKTRTISLIWMRMRESLARAMRLKMWWLLWAFRRTIKRQVCAGLRHASYMHQLNDLICSGISTGGTSWGEAGVKAAERVLKTPALEGLEIYLFRAIVPQKKLDIRLDKVTDLYGSPSIDDIEK